MSTTAPTGSLTNGRQAFSRGAWGDAYRHLSDADAAAPLEAGDPELLASSAQLIGKDRTGDELWMRAHNEYLRLGDAPRAGIVNAP